MGVIFSQLIPKPIKLPIVQRSDLRVVNNSSMPIVAGPRVVAEVIEAGNNHTFPRAIRDGLSKIVICDEIGHKENLILGILDQFDHAFNCAVIRRKEHFKLSSNKTQDRRG